MGSAVPSDCQKHWTSNTAARGLVASFIHEASSPACAGKEGESFCYPSWERHRLRDTTCTSNFLCQPWYVFARIEIHPFSAERLSGSCQRGQVFIQTGHVWGVTQELIFSPVLSNSRCRTNVLFLHSMKRKKMTLATIRRGQVFWFIVLLVLYYHFRGPFQTLNGFVETTEPRGIVSLKTSSCDLDWTVHVQKGRCGCGWL